MSEVLKGMNGVAAKLDSYHGKMSTQVAKAMIIVANKILTESAKIVPVDTGELMSRGFTEGPYYDESSGTWMAVVGYEKTPGVNVKHTVDAGAETGVAYPYGDKNPKSAGTLYAAAVHENMTFSPGDDGEIRSVYNHKGKAGGYTGRRAKYLEEPFDAIGPNFCSMVAAVAKKVKP